MNKNHKILISIGIVIVVVTAGVVFQVNKTNQALAYTKQQDETKIAQETKKANDYESAIKSIKEEKFPEAKNSLQNLKGYKDADAILQYVRGLTESKEKSPNYKMISMYFESVPTDYKGDLAKEINEFRTQVKNNEDTLIKQKEISIVNLIKKGDYDQAKSNASLEFPVLYSYAYALDYEKKGDHSMALFYWKDISSDYSGPMSTEILKSVNVYSSDIQKLNQSLASVKTQQSKPQPKIGMTSDDVLSSQWGKPTKVNKTTTVNNVSEQWVYSSGKYVYLKDGIVTAIQGVIP